MFLVFKLSFVVDILAFFDLATFGPFFEKFGEFFSIRLVTLKRLFLMLNPRQMIKCMVLGISARLCVYLDANDLLSLSKGPRVSMPR